MIGEFLDLAIAFGFVALIVAATVAFVLVSAAGLNAIPFRDTTVLQYFVERIGLQPEPHATVTSDSIRKNTVTVRIFKEQ